jgi:antitoxin MazE
MRVTKWGNSLGIRLPKKVVEAMKLEAGDHLAIATAGDGRYEISKRERRKELIEGREAILVRTGAGRKVRS